MNKILQKSIEKEIQAIGQQTQGIVQEYDEFTNRNNQLVTDLVNSNQVDSSIVKTVSNLLNTKSQFRLEPVEGNPNLFIIIPFTNPQQVLIKVQRWLSRMVTLKF